MSVQRKGGKMAEVGTTTIVGVISAFLATVGAVIAQILQAMGLKTRMTTVESQIRDIDKKMDNSLLASDKRYVSRDVCQETQRVIEVKFLSVEEKLESINKGQETIQNSLIGLRKEVLKEIRNNK